MGDGISLCDDKYFFFLDGGGILTCTRNDEPWRDFLGDNAVHALFEHVQELDKVVKEAKALCEKFVGKVELGIARSRVTYAECKVLLDSIKEIKE